MLLTVPAFADTPSITISVDNGSGGTDLSMDMILKSANGTFKASDNLNISVNTTNTLGYTLSIAGSTVGGGTPLINGTNTELVIPSIESSVSATDFAADSVAGAAYNDKWGYLPSKYNSVANTSTYYPGPSAAGDVLNVTTAASETDSETGEPVNDEYTISFGTRISEATAPGEYSNTFVITAIANFAGYTISYNANTADTVSGIPTATSGYAVDQFVTLSTNLPTREGYVFKGWCTDDSSENACAGTLYSRGSELLISEGINNNIELYAIWGQTLYDKVASLVKTVNGEPRTQTLADMQAVITAPTSNNPATDTSNSGVYLYDSEYFGEASDASNDYDIYYYRGILDSSFAGTDQYGGIGSSGDGAYYPNYVKLDNDTCWRIVRTTGSGGTKMIYNGTWTGSNCANTQVSIGITYLNRGRAENSGDDHHGTDQFVTYAGYSYNPIYAYNNISYTYPVNNSILFNNDSASNLRFFNETWFSNNMQDNSVILEKSAGYCNDRSTYNATSGYQTIPYSDSSVAFGVVSRVFKVNEKLSLTCPNHSGEDLLATGNGLSYPTALLTADEASLFGDGRVHDDPAESSQFASNYSRESYLRSGRHYWLLSPNGRVFASSSDSWLITNYLIYADGATGNTEVSANHTVRPVISLTHDISVAGGSGTATDPWTIEVTFDTAFAAAGKHTYNNSHYYAMQDMESGICSAVSTGQVTTLIDNRDGTLYHVSKLADGRCWMLDNLALDPTSPNTTLTASNTNATVAAITNYLNGGNPSGNEGWSTEAVVNKTSGWNSTAPNNAYEYPYVNVNYKNDTTTKFGVNGSGKVGVYYNYCAATASTYCYAKNAGVDVSDTDIDAPIDICPANWRMPTGGSTGEYQALCTILNGSTACTNGMSMSSTSISSLQYNLDLSLPGYFGNSSQIDIAIYGSWWSSTGLNNGTHMYRLRVNSSQVWPINGLNRTYGSSIRCIAK